MTAPRPPAEPARPGRPGGRRARLAGAASALLSRIGDALYPPLCPVTKEETGAAGTLSPAAWAELGLLLSGPRCGRCGREVPGAVPAAELVCEPCAAQPHLWDRGAAAMRYEGTGRRLVLALKHGDRLDLVPLLAGWMARARPELLAGAELVVPVPLHWRRLLSRRFNQSAELARRLARLSGRPGAYAPRLLRRLRATPPQRGRDHAERSANLAGAIVPGAQAGRMAGRRVLLVDDVLTTGATLDACAAACRAAGAAGVDILVAALVPFDRLPYVSCPESR